MNKKENCTCKILYKEIFKKNSNQNNLVLLQNKLYWLADDLSSCKIRKTDDCRKYLSSVQELLENLVQLIPWDINNRELETLKFFFQKHFPHDKYCISLLNDEIEQRKQKGITDRDLPSPAVILVDKEKGKVYFSEWTTCENHRLDKAQNFLNEIQTTLKQGLNNQPPYYALTISNKTRQNLDITGKSAMLSYWIKAWHEMQKLEIPESIAATGEIAGEKIEKVDSQTIELKISAALSLGYKKIIYPYACRNVIPKDIKEKYADRLLPFDNLIELANYFYFANPAQTAKRKLKQYLEETRPLNDYDLEKLAKVWLEHERTRLPDKALHSHLYQLKSNADFVNSDNFLCLTRIIYKLIKKMLLESSSTDAQLSFLKNFLPQPVWLSLLPFLIKSLYRRERIKSLNDYRLHHERFYNHDQALTIAHRLYEKLYRINPDLIKENKEFRKVFRHLFGFHLFDIIHALSELSEIKDKTSSEKKLFLELLEGLDKTPTENIVHIGTEKLSEEQQDDYYAELRKVISNFFPGFQPLKYRYLRYDQRLGSLCRILVNSHQEDYNKKIIFKHIKALLNSPPGNKPSYFDINPEFYNFLEINNYTHQAGLQKLLKIAEKNPDQKGYNQLGSLENHLLNLSVKKDYLKIPDNKYYEDLRVLINELTNNDNPEKKIIHEIIDEKAAKRLYYSPVILLIEILMEKNLNEKKLFCWLKMLAEWCYIHSHIYNVQAQSIGLAFYAGLNSAKELSNNFINLITELNNAALTMAFLTGMDSQNNSIVVNKPTNCLPKLPWDIDYSLAYLLKPDSSLFFNSMVTKKLESSNTSIEQKNNLHIILYSAGFENILAKHLTGSEIQEVKNNLEEIKNCSNLLNLRRNYRKIFYLHLLRNQPEKFFKIKLQKNDPEMFSLTFLYLLSKYQFDDIGLQKRVRKRLLKAGKSLYDRTNINAIRIFESYEKAPEKLKKINLKNELNLQEFFLINSLESSYEKQK